MNAAVPPCQDCRFRQRIPGDAHSACGLVGNNPIETYGAAMLGELEPPTFDPRGVARGWCEWPLNFDPIWIIACQHRLRAWSSEAQP
jgi:hypothetical protein